MQNIPKPILIIMTLIVGTTNNVTRGFYSKKFSSSQTGFHILNIGVSLICAFILSAFCGFDIACSPFTFWLGCAFGVATALQAIAYMSALNLGPLSITTVIVSLSTIITALSGLFWNETITIFQIVALLLMIVCFVLSAKKDEQSKKANAKWLVILCVAFLLSGAIGILQKIHQMSEHSAELYQFLTIAFIVSALLSVAFLPFVWKRDKQNGIFMCKTDSKNVAKLFSLVVVTGVCVAFNNAINLFLSGELPAAIFFPIVNGGGLVLGVISGLVFFKEKPTVKQYLGLGAGIAAMMLLCI